MAFTLFAFIKHGVEQFAIHINDKKFCAVLISVDTFFVFFYVGLDLEDILNTWIIVRSKDHVLDSSILV